MTDPLLIEDINLSVAWARVLKHIIDNPGKEISPLILSLTDYRESYQIRGAVDRGLNSNKLSSIQTVSETIFPESLYRFCGNDRELLYLEYLKNLPRIKKIVKSNSKGTYFGRLISYDGAVKNVNQLEIIISSLLDDSKVKRRSKLQASVFNPHIDHTNNVYQGFPCLQHITFYKTKDNGLVMNSFYAIQYFYKRAYGNWLGLINLGKFVAKEANLELVRFNCYVGVEHLDNISKTEAQSIYDGMNLKAFVL